MNVVYEINTRTPQVGKKNEKGWLSDSTKKNLKIPFFFVSFHFFSSFSKIKIPSLLFGCGVRCHHQCWLSYSHQLSLVQFHILFPILPPTPSNLNEECPSLSSFLLCVLLGGHDILSVRVCIYVHMRFEWSVCMWSWKAWWMPCIYPCDELLTRTFIYQPFDRLLFIFQNELNPSQRITTHNTFGRVKSHR